MYRFIFVNVLFIVICLYIMTVVKVTYNLRRCEVHIILRVTVGIVCIYALSGVGVHIVSAGKVVAELAVAVVAPRIRSAAYA